MHLLFAFPMFSISPFFIRLPLENINGKVYNPQLPSPNLDKYLICVQKTCIIQKKTVTLHPHLICKGT